MRNQLRAARDHQSASAEILRTIAGTPGDAGRSLQQIAETSARLFGAPSVSIQLAEGSEFTQEYRVGAIAKRVGSAYPRSNIKVGGRNLPGTVVAENRQIHIPDLDHLDPSMSDFPGLPHARAGGARTVCGTPLRREHKAIGALIVLRDRLLPFTGDELALLQSFADQAVIAIENARLFNEVETKSRELGEALQQQTATAEVLQVISNSPGELGPVFTTVLENATRICDAGFGTLLRFDGNAFYFAADVGTPAALAEYVRRPGPFEGLAGGMVDRILRTRQVQHSPDYAADAAPGLAARLGGARSTLGVPILRDDVLVGAIVIYRQEVRPFSNREIDLVRSFAAQAAIAIENARLFNETKEALERQTATADILRVISLSPTDVQPVFNALVLTAQRLLSRQMAFILLCEAGTTFRPVAITGPEGLVQILNPTPIPIDPEANFPSRAIVSKKNQQFPDWSAIDLPEEERKIREMYGLSSALYLPMLRGGECIGVLGLGGRQPGSFSETDIALAESFRDQALIAIENARLFNETREALERQTATSEILRVISQSPTDVQPVFDAIALAAVRLLGCERAFIQRCDDVSFWTVSWCGPEGQLPILNTSPIPIDPEANFPSRAISEKKTLHLPDWSAIDLPEFERGIHARLGISSALYMPLLRESECIGLLAVAGKRTNIFGESEIALAESFRDQALIAIENTRLFNETREALERQTATSEVLKVISDSPGELKPVFNAMLENAVRICEAKFGNLFLVDGDSCRWTAGVGTPEKLAEYFTQSTSFRPTPGSHLDRVMKTKQVSHTADDTAEAVVGAAARFGGARSTVCVPMVKDEALVGAIFIYRTEVRPFTDKQIDLVKDFAAQAVIAIENVRLFTELKQSLDQQTSSAEILRVISSSPTDVQPVFDAIVASLLRLFGTEFAAVQLLRDGNVTMPAVGGKPGFERLAERFPRPLDDTTIGGLVMLSKQTRQFVTFEDSTTPVGTQQFARDFGFNSVMFTPMIHEGEVIGCIGTAHPGARVFDPHQVALIETFARQAVIAIQNARLFNETQEALERQTATADILKVIASSPSDVQPVFEAIAERSKRLVDALSTTVFGLDEGVMHLRAFTLTHPEADTALKALFPAPLADFSWGEAVGKGEIFRVVDTEGELGRLRELARLRGFRSMLLVPLLRDGIPIGLISVTRVEPGPFVEHHVQLLQTFADQAVIAISNVRLFQQVEERTRELSASLDDLRAAQDRLVQTEKLASLGQLTAGIAHEIKNPLNFVNNFSALSAELVGEMSDVLAQAALDKKTRHDMDELAQLLKSNLEKVVQHGQRADSIVKNMLLHSREGSGEHRPVDINALVDESLNLAYHGARAEKAAFNITMQRDFDPAAGMTSAYPQEITRVLLNLISNGFYATTKRSLEASDGFEPTLSAATRNLGDTVEIRIRDNGTGIPEEVREKIFNPFFTTKPAGEGTGLGLSMSHDIIVKQHGGTIDVETQPGQFTEFRIVLPRTSRR